jgi:VanZ family protein
MIHFPRFQKTLVYVFYAVLILFTVLFLAPTQFLPEESVFNFWDKAQHTLAFIALGILAFLAHPKTYAKALIFLIIYGALIEVLQSMTSWRRGDLLDWIADALGVLIVWACLVVYQRFWVKANTPPSTY